MVAQGVTVLVTTAYMDEAERCDHVALLDHGRIIALDTPVALQRTLAGRMVAVRTSDPRRALQVLERTPAAHHAALFGDTIHLAMDSRDRDWPTLEAALTGAGFDVVEVRDLDPSLEDVFIQRVSETATDAVALP